MRPPSAESREGSLPDTKKNVCYMLRCADGSLYTGWTNDLEGRLRAHNEGRGGKYTRSRRPVTLAYAEACETRGQAMSREWHVKRLGKAQKEALAAAFRAGENTDAFSVRGGKDMTDITAIGEILIDLTQSGRTEQGIPRFDANPGGAPANLAVAASRLGAKTAFIGRVGRDSYGDFLRATLEENGVDVSGMSVDPVQHTTLAVVSLDKQGERSFSFYRDPSADVNLRFEDVPEELLANTRVLHFGSVSLTAEPSRSATLRAAAEAKAHGAWISYDPNYRASLWPDEEGAIEQMLRPLPLVDILKVSDEELPLLTGTGDLAQGSAALAEKGAKLVLVTLGPDGTFYRFGAETGRVPGVKVTVGGTNGAGDTFFGAARSQLVKRESLDALSTEELERILAFANKAAAVTTSRHGAIPAMPTREELA